MVFNFRSNTCAGIGVNIMDGEIGLANYNEKCTPGGRIFAIFRCCVKPDVTLIAPCRRSCPSPEIAQVIGGLVVVIEPNLIVQ
jgi:hypothetical protein